MRFDWELIRDIYEHGSPSTMIAKLPAMPTRQAIEARAKREGWRHPVEARWPTPALGKKTSQTIECILSMLRRGTPITACAMRVGVTRDTLYKWMRADNSFYTAVRAAQGEMLDRQAENITTAGRRDWKASAWILERHPETRSEMGQHQQQPQVNITLNIDRQGVEWKDGRPVLDLEE